MQNFGVETSLKTTTCKKGSSWADNIKTEPKTAMMGAG